MQMHHSGVDVFVISRRGSARPCKIVTIFSWTFYRRISCLHVDFERFRLQKFMNFWSLLSALALRFCRETHDFFYFSHDKTPNLMVFREILFWNEMLLCSKKRNCLLLLNRNSFSLYINTAETPNVNFRKISVRKTIWDLWEFSEHLL